MESRDDIIQILSPSESAFASIPPTIGRFQMFPNDAIRQLAELAESPQIRSRINLLTQQASLWQMAIRFGINGQWFADNGLAQMEADQGLLPGMIAQLLIYGMVCIRYPKDSEIRARNLRDLIPKTRSNNAQKRDSRGQPISRENAMLIPNREERLPGADIQGLEEDPEEGDPTMAADGLDEAPARYNDDVVVPELIDPSNLDIWYLIDEDGRISSTMATAQYITLAPGIANRAPTNTPLQWMDTPYRVVFDPRSIEVSAGRLRMKGVLARLHGEIRLTEQLRAIRLRVFKNQEEVDLMLQSRSDNRAQRPGEFNEYRNSQGAVYTGQEAAVIKANENAVVQQGQINAHMQSQINIATYDKHVNEKASRAMVDSGKPLNPAITGYPASKDPLVRPVPELPLHLQRMPYQPPIGTDAIRAPTAILDPQLSAELAETVNHISVGLGVDLPHDAETLRRSSIEQLELYRARAIENTLNGLKPFLADVMRYVAVDVMYQDLNDLAAGNPIIKRGGDGKLTLKGTLKIEVSFTEPAPPTPITTQNGNTNTPADPGPANDPMPRGDKEWALS